MNHSIGKFFRAATGKQDGQVFWNDQHPRQGLTGFEPFIRMPDHGVDIVGDDNAALRSGPIQNLWVILLKELCVLHEYIVERGKTPLLPSEDPLVEILIHEQWRHGLVSGGRKQLRAAMAEAFTKCCRLRPALNQALKLSGFLLTPAKVVVHFSLMLEVEGDGTVDGAERQRRETILNLLSGGALIELINHCIERNPRTGQADGAVPVFIQRGSLVKRDGVH